MPTLRVALFIEPASAYSRALLGGVAEYVKRHGPWSVHLPQRGSDDQFGKQLLAWDGDGIIVWAENRTTAAAVQALRIPTVDVCPAGLLPEAPTIHSDTRAEAQLAFEHFWDRGFRHFAFCGVIDQTGMRERHESFRATAEAMGASVEAIVRPLAFHRAADCAADRAALSTWLRALPKPVGILACCDARGQQVLDACRATGLRVPDDVGVIGVENDAVRCELSDPPLSSVAPDAHRIGYSAAELLTRMMNGDATKPGPHLVAPLGVVARRSTDSLAVADPDVELALRFIRENLHRPIDVGEILDRVQVSRRTLENRFLEHVGRTPHAELTRCRVECAKKLLRETTLPIKAIAGRVGVGSPEYLSVLFKRVLGTTPSAYRRAQYAPSATSLARRAIPRLAMTSSR